jgi:hypothetical protein
MGATTGAADVARVHPHNINRTLKRVRLFVF